MFTTKGLLNKREFKTGILLGFWDRQTNDNHIVMDDSRNIKHLRWGADETTDVTALKYVQNTMKKKAAEIEGAKNH